MPEPKATVLGVHRPHVSRELFEEQMDVYGDEELTREHFAGLVLIEVLLEDLDQKFEMRHFRQVVPGSLPGQEQVAYDEALLSNDGMQLIERDLDCVKGQPPLRCAFYLHYYHPELPLQWTYGDLRCPAESPLPARLRDLVPYRATD